MRSRRATSGAPARPRTRRSATGSNSRSTAPGPPARRPSSGSTRHAPMTRNSSPRWRPTWRTTTPSGLDIRIMPPAEACTLQSRAHRPGRGHHFRHRQCAARLPHRPLPDPRGRHQRQDALDRSADERRRSFRNRRRRLRAQARAAVRRRKLSALGFARRIPRLGRLVRAPRRDLRQRKQAKVLAETLDAATAKFLEENKSPAARSASSTTAAATSIWPSTGRRPSPRKATMPS